MVHVASRDSKHPYIPVGHSNEQYVVQSIHTINLGQQLVDDGVMRGCTISNRTTLLANGINLVKYDDVQLLQL